MKNQRRRAWKTFLVGTGIVLACLTVAFLGFVWLSTYHPSEREAVAVTCPYDAPLLSPGQEVKVLTWNVQFMAGKNYVFFYDLLDGSGPDERPSAADIRKTLDEVSRIIQDEDPDVVLLQEVDDGAKRTDYQDQLAELLGRLPGRYPCHCSAFYWKAWYVPYPRIMGAVGIKLSVISKYKIGRATRHQLGLMPYDPISRQFRFKRAVLEVRLPTRDGNDFVVLDTHLEAFTHRTDILQRQVAQVKAILDELNREGFQWIIGGDFNLLPPGPAYTLLSKGQQVYYHEKTEISPLFDAFQAVPSLEETHGPDRALWFTYFSNDRAVKAPDRTIDYIFMPRSLPLIEHHVRQHDTLRTSDHFPVVVTVKIP